MRTLRIDIETYSSADLLKSGVYKYVEAADFTILLFAYAFDKEDIQIIDLAQGEQLPAEVLTALTDSTVLKKAFNANFERTCIAKHFAVTLPVDQWQCTSVKAAMAGYPHSLDQASKVMGLDYMKDSNGKALIRFFSLPCKPTKANGMRSRNLPLHDLVKWQQFKEYCVNDVKVERAVDERLRWFKIPVAEQKLWQLDQQINDGGIAVDLPFVRKAIAMDFSHREHLVAEAVELTKLDNPNSAAQLKEWIGNEMGEEVSTLRKNDIPELLKATDCDVVTRVLQLRTELAKTSVKKYEAIDAAVCKDSRVRGLLQYYGANRTGRWAGRLVQVQNLPQNHLSDLELARDIVLHHDSDLVELLFGSVPDVLSQLIRTAFVPSTGHRFIVADFSAIEARVIAWLAGEQWRLDVFNTHGKIYEASASQMFKIPIHEIKKGSDLRQKGKVAELALGYQGGPNALIQMGALKMGIAETELPKLVRMWRNANPAIVQLWEDVDAAAIAAVNGRSVTLQFGLKFYRDNDRLCIELPSGRTLFYINPSVTEGKFGNEALQYYGLNQNTKTWSKTDSYGGKLVENIVQAIARDCLAEAMLRIAAQGYRIAMHVHDEVVLDVPVGYSSTARINQLMSEPISWAPGLPLTADSYETDYYKKD